MNKFYPVAGMVALSAVITACQQADKQEKKQYNIVYIMTDDHTAQMMSCYDTRYMETPNLDALPMRGALHEQFCGKLVEWSAVLV